MKIGYLMQEGGPDVRRPPFTGPANHVRHVFNNLRHRGHHIRLIAKYEGVIWQSDDLIHFSAVETPEMETGGRRWMETMIRGTQARLRLPYFNYFDSLRFSSACQQKLSNHDLIYERLGWMSFAGAMFAQKKGIPRILEINNGDFLRELRALGHLPEGLQLTICVELMRRSMRQADLIIASGDGHKQKLIELWGIDPAKITVIENGSVLVEHLDRSQLLSFQSQGHSKRATQLVYAGAFEPWQGVDILLQAYQGLIEEGYPVQLTLAGDGSEYSKIIELVRELNLQSSVRITGPLNLDKLASILSESDIGLAPYCGWPEYSGLKLFDYKSAGLAIVVSGEDGRPKTIDHNRTGIIVRPCDVENLKRAVARLVEDSELRRSLGQAAREEAERLHSWANTVQQIEVAIGRIFDK